ncbi:MAG TPA: CpsD/CapB family tyrosine-protein kinase [Candidatus Eisenbacteria bacterium]|nr:CpsD/CapB family tyrosine-protein kinase [Candidatus Eisenbacteria bacterium]
MLFAKQETQDLLEGFQIDAPYVTEVRRLLQSLWRQQGTAKLEKQVYMVTSAAREEGKSTTCALMAVVTARVFRRKTLLIDGDLRRPTVHSLLRLARGPGLREILQGTMPIREATRATALPLLSVITRGDSNSPASEAYTDEAFAQLIAHSRANYDFVFVDAAPVVPVIEPILMAEHVDSILVVAMAGKTPVTAVRRSMQILAPVIPKIAGVVLNNAMNGLPYYYDYRYYGYKERRPRTTVRPDAPAAKEEGAPTSDREPEGER